MFLDLTRAQNPNASMSTVSTVLGFSLLATSWTMAICLAYNGTKFYQRRHETAFVKRRANLVIAYTVCCCILLFISMPVLLFTKFNWFLAPSPDSQKYMVLDLVLDVLWNPFYTITTWLFLCRYWLIYYDIQFVNACYNHQWKACITHELGSLKQDIWFIDKRGTLGNAQYLLKLLAVFLCGVIGAVTALSVLETFGVFSYPIYYYLQMLVTIVQLVIFLIIWRKMPFFQDQILLYREFRLISIVWFSVVIIVVVTVIVMAFSSTVLFPSAVNHLAMMLAIFSASFVSTYWVLNQTKLLQQVETETAGTPLSLNEIFRDFDMLNLFMRHLMQEFCLENLLAIIEFHQFRAEALKTFQCTGLDTTSCADIAFADNCPQSDIVFRYLDPCIIREDEEDESKYHYKVFKSKAYRLYQKYIVSGAEFEINIAHSTRLRFYHLMYDYDNWVSGLEQVSHLDIVQLFDECILEMFQLLKSVKTRFKCAKI